MEMYCYDSLAQKLWAKSIAKQYFKQLEVQTFKVWSVPNSLEVKSFLGVKITQVGQKAADLRVGRIMLSAVTIRYVSLLVFT